jgi:outer membrane protein assembly factor BamA
MKRVVIVTLLIIIFGHSELYASSGTDSTQALEKIEIMKSRHGRVLIFPYVFYTPETALAFGIGGIITFYTSEYLGLRPSKLSLSGYYSTNKQYKFTLTPQIYLIRNQLFLSMDLIYGHFIERFYGIGNDAPDTGEEEYSANSWGATATVQLPPLIISKSPYAKVGLIFDYLNYLIDNVKDNPYLQDNKIYQNQDKINAGLGFTWVWDNRDDIFYPTHGMFHQLSALFYLKEIGSHYVFNRYKVDLRHYLSVAPSHILAIQVFINAVGNSAPFYTLAKLGGQQIMRGYYEGRYRDKNFLAGQLEYRTHLWQRFGFIAFGGLGEVMSELRVFRLDSLKPSIGFGLRFLFSKQEKVNLRADIGFGQNTKGVYFGIEEAF